MSKRLNVFLGAITAVVLGAGVAFAALPSVSSTSDDSIEAVEMPETSVVTTADSIPDTTDVTTGDSIPDTTDVTTGDSIPDSTSTTMDDHSGDDSTTSTTMDDDASDDDSTTSTTIDDSDDDSTTSTTIDDSDDDSTTSTTMDDSTTSTTTATSVPGPTGQTEDLSFDVDGGTIGSLTVAWDGASLSFVSASAADGWTWSIDENTAHSVEVDFRNGTRRVRAKVQAENNGPAFSWFDK